MAVTLKADTRKQAVRSWPQRPYATFGTYLAVLLGFCALAAAAFDNVRTAPDVTPISIGSGTPRIDCAKAYVRRKRDTVVGRDCSESSEQGKKLVRALRKSRADRLNHVS
jgi:hypothetical protein